MSDGWSLINKEAWKAPLYWVQKGGNWFEFTLSGLIPLNLDAPLTHISYYHIDVDGMDNRDAAWYYPDPSDAAEPIRDHVAFWKGIEVKA